MLVKYFFYLLLIFTFGAVLNLIFVPVNFTFETSKLSDSFKKIYSDITWSRFNENLKVNKKIEIIQSVLKYNDDFKIAYEELCQNIETYLVSKTQTDQIAKLLNNAYQKYKTQKFASCYVKSLESLSKFDKATKFLKNIEQNSKKPFEKNYYFKLINNVINNKNILKLSKALENYYTDNKTYPGDITILKDQGYIDEIPEDPYGGQYYLANKGQIRSTSAR